MIAIYEINRECDTSELTELATYIGHEGVFKTGFRYRELDISNSSIESNTTIQIDGLRNHLEAEAIREKIREKLNGVTVEMYIEPEHDVEF